MAGRKVPAKKAQVKKKKRHTREWARKRRMPEREEGEKNG